MEQEIENYIQEYGTISDSLLNRVLKCSDKQRIYELSHKISQRFASKHFEMCSIINAKSGLCAQDCKWCAQSMHYHTSVETFDVIPAEHALCVAKELEAQQVERFSLVTSGRCPNKAQFEKLLKCVEAIHKQCGIKICASMGLLNEFQLMKLKNAGVVRYHCNLETSADYFSRLVTTHSQAEKIETINAAKRIGMDICCGGILGMGETVEQRIELSRAIHALGSLSIPLNLLQPIKGTPLEHTPPMSEEEFLEAVIIFRLINPYASIRFAGGRSQLSIETIKKALYIGINSAIVGDLLTTIGSNVEQDKTMILEAHYTL